MIARIATAGRRLVSPATAGEPLSDRPQRYYLLDASRALASLAVLFWHYQHFYVPVGTYAVPPDLARREPLHGVFALLYDQGHYAVAIFWMISGFVFAAVYLPARASTRSFAVNRFARLYPLHALTLVVVALLQLAITAKYGTWLVYENNDLYHFVLQVFFAGRWGLERGDSFNGPIWSVSVEILIYVVFWAIHRWVARFGIVLPTVLAAGFFALSLVFPRSSIFPCGQYFFVGVALYVVHAALTRDRTLLGAIAVIALPVGLYALHRDLMVVGLPGVFGMLLLLLVAAEDRVAPAARRPLGIVGDATYGMYLWHFPAELVIFLALPATAIPALADHGWFLALFLVMVIALARISYLVFERPSRDWLRGLAGGRRRTAQPHIAAP